MDATAATTTWRWFDSGAGGAAFNMAMDHALMELAPSLGAPTLRFYGWNEPAATFGYSQHCADIEKMTPLRPLIRRPTGGGLVPHDADWTYSFAVPPDNPWYGLKAAESYLRMHEWVRAAFESLGIRATLAPQPMKITLGQCFIGAEKSDVLWRGRKIAGAAQRRSKQGLLIQGSVQSPPGAPPRAQWQESMLRVAREKFGGDWIRAEPDPALFARAQSLQASKYALPSHNQGR